MAEALYNEIGEGYAAKREPDPRIDAGGISRMHRLRIIAIASLLGLASCISDVAVARTASTDLQAIVLAKCPASQSVIGKGLVGDRAIVAEDGSAFAIQCGNGHVLTWTQNKEIRDWGERSLFSVAKEVGLLPSDLSCPPWLKDGLPQESNCTVIDSRDQHTFLMKDDVRRFLMERGQEQPVREFSIEITNGLLSSGNGKVVAVRPYDYPPRLVLIEPTTGEETTLFSVPFEDSIVGNLESNPYQVFKLDGSSDILISFEGAFLGVHEMTYVARYGIDGTQRWRIRDSLPISKDGFTGDFAFVHLLEDGRIVAFQKRSDETLFLLLDAGTGKRVRSAKGGLIATAKSADRLLIRTNRNGIAFVQMNLSAK